jgi:hypothetical protein
MNESPWPKALLLILAIISLWSLYLCWSYFRDVRHLRDMQMQMNAINYNQQVFGLMLNEANEYGKKNPAMESLLHSLGVTQVPGPAAITPAPGRTPGK